MFLPSSCHWRDTCRPQKSFVTESIQNLLCASLFVTWHEIVKLSKSSTETSLYWRGQNEMESRGNYVDKSGQKYPTIESKVPLAQIIQSDCPRSPIYQDNEFYPILCHYRYIFGLWIWMTWWYFISLEIIIGAERASAMLKDDFCSYDNSPRKFKLHYSIASRYGYWKGSREGGMKSVETQMLITNLSLPFSSPLSLNVSLYSSWLLFWSLDNWLNEPENFIRFHINNNILLCCTHKCIPLCVFNAPLVCIQIDNISNLWKISKVSSHICPCIGFELSAWDPQYAELFSHLSYFFMLPEPLESCSRGSESPRGQWKIFECLATTLGFLVLAQVSCISGTTCHSEDTNKCLILTSFKICTIKL